MKNEHRFYINGEWVNSSSTELIEIENPSTEEVIGTISAGTKDDIDLAVAAAKNAFKSFGFSSKEDRIAILDKGVLQQHDEPLNAYHNPANEFVKGFLCEHIDDLVNTANSLFKKE